MVKKGITTMGIGAVEIFILFALLLGLLIAALAVVTVFQQASKHSNRVSELESRIERLERQLGRTSEPTAPKSRE
jgi:hypothetical protein